MYKFVIASICVFISFWNISPVLVARKAEFSTELLDKQSTIGGVAAAAASDHEYLEQGTLWFWMHGYLNYED